MNARQRFECARHAVKRLRDVQLAIMYECDDWQPPKVKAGGKQISDPTATRAIYRVDVLGEKLAALQAEESDLLEEIGTALEIIAAVRGGFGEIYAYLLEWRYIDCMKWRDIEADHGYSKSTGCYLLSIAFDWVDSVGVSRLLNGDTEI